MMDYLAGLLEIAGVLMIGNLHRQGFLLCLICNAIWVDVAIKSGVHGLIPVSLVMAVCNTRNYLKWSRDDPAVLQKGIEYLNKHSRRYD